MTYALLTVLAIATSGCSLCFVTPAAPPSKRECTSSRLAPIVDSVLGGYEAVRTGYAIFGPGDVYERIGVPREADIALGAGLTAVFVGSAIYGYVKTAECDEYEATPIDDSFP